MQIYKKKIVEPQARVKYYSAFYQALEVLVNGIEQPNKP